MSEAALQQVNDSDFDSQVLQESLPVVVDFWGPMCGPCKALEPVLEELAGKYQGRLKVVKVNVDECPQTAIRFAVKALPTILLFHGGKVVDQFTGRPTPAALARFIHQVM
ncbi:MAG: thioredoxin [Deltaproteobacteria bacterium]|nr:MAG: thioredoxin [Deltaproteobacteria bacterium]